jgi:hypothetical protein
MGRREARFTLLDDFDEKHEYFVTAHGARAGVRLFNKLMRVVAANAGRVAEIFGTAGAGNPFDVELNEVMLDDGTFNLAKLATINWGRLSSALREAAFELTDTFTPELYAEIFTFTSRDQKEYRERTPNYRGHFVELKEPAYFDAAFAANYGELFTATWKVLELNFAPLLRAKLRRMGIQGTTFLDLFEKVSSAYNKASTANPESGTLSAEAS